MAGEWIRVPSAMRRALTPKQGQTLELLCNGLSAKEIAHTLQLSVLTVQGYTKAIYAQLNVHSRAELLVRLIHEMQGQMEELVLHGGGSSMTQASLSERL